jgi:hypothetical protein
MRKKQGARLRPPALPTKTNKKKFCPCFACRRRLSSSFEVFDI